MNGCEESIIEREPQWYSNAGSAIIIGEEDSISFISSKGDELVYTQSTAAYSQEAYVGGHLKKAYHS